MHNHCINKLLDLEDVLVKKVVHADTLVKIFIETKPKEHVCPYPDLFSKRNYCNRQVSWAIERVRKRLQKTMPANLRRYNKYSRTLMLNRYSKLNSEKKACDLMLPYNNGLRLAHYLKERFFDICQNPKYSEQRTDFFDQIKMAENSGLKEFEDCARIYRNWSKEILRAFKYKFISNSPTEGFNNKIKVLKRASYGVRNFKRYRTRILLATN